MKIGIQTIGTRGDVYPYLELAGGLSRVGHEVTLVITAMIKCDYSHYADKYNIRLIEASNEDCYKHGERIGEYSEEQNMEYITAIEACGHQASESLCQENDIVIGNQGAYYLQVFAEREDIPYVTVSMNHSIVPTKHRPFWLYGQKDLGEEINNYSWWQVEQSINQDFAAHINTYRAKFGMPPIENVFHQITHSPSLHLISTSTAFCPQQEDWEGHRYVCGYFLFEDDAIPLPEGLAKFLAAGDPPVMITFRSAMSIEVKNAINMTIKSARREKRSVILQSFGDAIDLNELDLGKDVFVLSGVVNYKDVFPYCAAVVHHGGAGTTHNVSLHGTPSVVLPGACDMPFWGAVLHGLGVAPEPLSLYEVTDEEVYKRVKSVLTDKQYKENAVRLGQQMKKDKPIESAIEAIEKKFVHLMTEAVK